MSENAYWLTPQGKLIKPKSRHIITVVKNPTQFGETKKSLQTTFDKYNEQMNSNIEGKAREEILLRVIKRGFARIRLGGTKRNQRWSIQLNRLTSKLEDALWQWANQIIKDGSAPDKYADVIIHQIGKGDKMTRTDLNTIAEGGDIKEQKEFIRIYEEDEVKDLPRWVDYAHEIDPKSLSEQAKIEILAHRFRG